MHSAEPPAEVSCEALFYFVQNAATALRTWSGPVFLLIYMMISVPSFIAHHKVRGAVFQYFLSFYVANLLFVLWGVVNG